MSPHTYADTWVSFKTHGEMDLIAGFVIGNYEVGICCRGHGGVGGGGWRRRRRRKPGRRPTSLSGRTTSASPSTRQGSRGPRGGLRGAQGAASPSLRRWTGATAASA
eukprot:scaffold306704_cov35-Prasinocladus_malaysianus.AAC.1